MNAFPRRNSVLIMDNTRVHHGGNIKQLCEVQSVLLVYFPKMNPIEKVFLVLKSQLKSKNIITGRSKDPEIVKNVLPYIVTPDLMAALFHGSNYWA